MTERSLTTSPQPREERDKLFVRKTDLLARQLRERLRQAAAAGPPDLSSPCPYRGDDLQDLGPAERQICERVRKANRRRLMADEGPHPDFRRLLEELEKIVDRLGTVLAAA